MICIYNSDRVPCSDLIYIELISELSISKKPDDFVYARVYASNQSALVSQLNKI